MSRTTRRKPSKHSHLKSWRIFHVDQVTRWDLERWSLSSPEDVVARETARFHSDAGSVCGHGGVPHWFRRHLNKRVDRANKAEIYRCSQSECWDDFLAHPHVSNAGWYWW